MPTPAMIPVQRKHDTKSLWLRGEGKVGVAHTRAVDDLRALLQHVVADAALDTRSQDPYTTN